MKDTKRFKFEGEDNRGKVWSFVISKEPLEELLLFYTKKGAVRGGDYHGLRQFNIVLRGQIRLVERFGEDPTVPIKGKVSGEKVQYLQEGDMRMCEGNIPHWFVSLTDSWMLEWHERPRSKGVYQPYREIVEIMKKQSES